MKMIIRFSFLLFFIAASQSCNKSLELEPISQISRASFWKSADDVKGALTAMYVSLKGESYNVHYLGEFRSDVLESSFSLGPYKYWKNQLTANDPGPSWNTMYKVIHNANLLIKYVPTISGMSAEAANEALAQAYATRAYVYFMMVKTWGELPLYVEPVEAIDPKSVQKERVPVAEIFELIKSDLDKAVDGFANMNYPSHRCQWSKPAVLALKADVYLWTAKHEGGGNVDLTVSLAALNEIQNSDTRLLDDFNSIFRYGNKGNKEIIFALRYADGEGGQNIGQLAYMISAYILPSFSTKTLAEIGVPGGTPNMAISKTVRDQFSLDDQRRNATFYEMYAVLSGSPDEQYYGSFVRKYQGHILNGSRVFLDDIVIYRYADILLMKAEVKNALGQDPSDEMNAIRKRAYTTNFELHKFVNSSKEANDAEILKERLLEFTFEGKRWWDLIRFGKVFDFVTSLKDRQDPNLLLFPIPTSTLILETKIKQNPGY